MHFDIIMSNPPTAVIIDNAEYPINWGFQTGMKLDALLKSGKSNEEKLAGMLQLYYPIIPANVPEAINKAVWFYNCGEDPEKNEESKQRYWQRPKGLAYAFAQDASLVYAGFLMQYDMDLSADKSLHWWKFMALFESLGEDTKMSKVMYYRLARTTGMSKDRRAFINEMKKLYKIKDPFSGGKRMSLEDRNRKWLEYIAEKRKKIG